MKCTHCNGTGLEPEEIIKSGQLPSNRGKTYILRVLSVYKDLFKHKYGFNPIVSIPMFGKNLKKLLKDKTELQISAMMIVFFDWAGMTGDDLFTKQKMLDSGYNINWFFSTINSYEAYLRNIQGLDLDNEDTVREFVGKNMLAINNKQI